MATRKTFYEVVTEAVADLTTHGFDSVERVAYWQERLKEAAEKDLGSVAQMQETLRAAMGTIYRRLVDNGGALKYHPGVARFMLDKLRPQLQAELQRRIMASADLIKLNRQNAIAKTLQRFSGWASSVPKGGSQTTDKNEEKNNVKKALKQLPFEERRVLIDQGHKLTASINETIARDGGALAVKWRSNWRQAGYNYRKDHKERDGHVYLMKDSWAKKAGLIKVGSDGYYEDITAVGEEPFCRCYAIYIYNLRDLPPELLTKKGAAELARVREAMKNL